MHLLKHTQNTQFIEFEQKQPKQAEQAEQASTFYGINICIYSSALVGCNMTQMEMNGGMMWFSHVYYIIL